MTDNVAGAVSRMMIKNPHAEFVAQALPAIVNVLPLKEDFEENAPIYQNIYQLCTFPSYLGPSIHREHLLTPSTDDQSNQTVQQLTPQIIAILEKVMGPPEEQLEPETRELLKKTVQGLYQQQAGLFANHAALLSLAGAQ